MPAAGLWRTIWWRLALLGFAAVPTACGCVSVNHEPIDSPPVPKELQKVSHPPYIIEPPDILQIDLVTSVPKPPYLIRALDALSISVPNAPQDAPIAGVISVDPDGTIYLGPGYGAVAVRGLSLDQARSTIEQHLLKSGLKKPDTNLSLAQTRASQQIRGPHLVRADGTVGLGTYGAVRVVGLTLPEAKKAIESHLEQYFLEPEVSLDVVGYNSKIYYIVYDGGGAGQQVLRFPVTGNETVLDAVGQMYGLATVSDKRRIWVSRPSPSGGGHQILPVDWRAITEQGDPGTNYQLLPGDRVFVKAYPLVTADTTLARVIAPIERLLGVTLLGSGTVRSFGSNNNSGTGVP